MGGVGRPRGRGSGGERRGSDGGRGGAFAGGKSGLESSLASGGVEVVGVIWARGGVSAHPFEDVHGEQLAGGGTMVGVELQACEDDVQKLWRDVLAVRGDRKPV